MSILKQVTTKTETVPPRLVIYGTHGVGKSTFAANPKYSPIFLDIEGGLKRIKAPKLPRVESWKQLKEQLNALLTEKHEYGALVIDTIDWTERLIEDFVADEAGVDSVLAIPFGKGYAKCRTLVDELLSKLDELNSKKNMMIIILGHSQVKTYSSPTHDPFDRYMMKLNDKISSKIEEWCDVLGFVNYKMSVKKGEGLKEVNRGVGSGERTLFLNEKPAFKAKNRYALPDQMNFDLDGLVTAIYDEKRAIAQKAKADLPDWI